MLFASIAVISIVLGSDVSALDLIRPCFDYTINILRTNETTPTEIQFQTEESIGNEGHFSGLTPHTYRLNVFFLSYRNYDVQTEIITNVTVSTKRLMVNIPYIIYSYTFEFKLNGVSEPSLRTENCVKKLMYLPNKQVLVIDLAGELRQNSQCVLTFEGFSSSAYDTKTGRGAEGLRFSGEGGSSAIYTAFFMRNAHSVFPCMDHPALKAHFDLCLAFPEQFTVVSSMPPTDKLGGSSQSGNMKTVCFSQTPPISPHSLAFALMRNYQEYNATDSQTSVLAPYSIEGSTNWILKQADLAIERIRQLTGVAYPLPKIQFLIVTNPPPSAHESFGLIILNATSMRKTQQYSGNVAELYHSIVHQWLGGLVTIRNWNEICLQEGLTYFLECMFEEEYAPGALQFEIEASNRIGLKNTSKSLMNLVNNTDKIPKECHSVAPVIFFDMIQQLGQDFIGKFLRHLMSQQWFGNVGLDEWNDLMADVVPLRPLSVTANVKRWLEYSEPLNLYLQDMFVNYTIIAEDTSMLSDSFRTVLGLVYCSSDKEPHAVITSPFGTAISISNRTTWCVFDPDGLTLTYKIYDAFTYKRVLALDRADDFRHLTDKRLDKFADDFCLALLNNLILHVSADWLAWLDVFDLVKKRLNIDSHLACMCCITEPSIRKAACDPYSQKCSEIWLLNSVFASSSGSLPSVRYQDENVY